MMRPFLPVKLGFVVSVLAQPSQSSLPGLPFFMLFCRKSGKLLASELRFLDMFTIRFFFFALSTMKMKKLFEVALFDLTLQESGFHSFRRNIQ